MAAIETRRRAIPTWASTHVLLIVIGAVVWWPFARHMIFKFTDFPQHVWIAERMLATRQILEPHFLFHVVVIAVKLLVPAWSFETAGYAALVAALMATVAAAYAILADGIPTTSVWRHVVLMVPLSYAVVLAGPVHLLTLQHDELYMGYVAPNAYHSPTLLVLKPIALVLFWVVAGNPQRAGVRRTASIGVLTILSALAKPHFVLCLLPAVVVLGCWDGWAGRPVDKGRWIAVVVPGLLVLAWQYAFARHGRLSAGIEWAPLKVVSFFSANLGVKFAMSILFPIAVLLGAPSAWHQPYLRLAWVAFGFGCLQAYGFAERGAAYIDGNLLWSAQIACAVLYVASLKALLDETLMLRPHTWARRGALLVCWLVFGLHVASGLVTYEHSATERPFT